MTDLRGPVLFCVAAAILQYGMPVMAADYAGSATCRPCHPMESQTQSITAHARALSRTTAGQPGDWAFGAGTQAITFVRRLDADHYLEEARTWYRELNGYARTPGHSTSNGVRDRIFDPSAAILRCFACHSTGPLKVTTEQGIIPQELGVRCEACHGPSGAHVSEPNRVRPRNPGRLAAAEINSLCGTCHRMPAKEHDETSLRDPWNVRHQPFMLATSNCFLRSNGRLSCFNCHSAHDPLQTQLTAYDSACAKCHASPSHKTAIGNRACVACHMPAVRPQPHLVFSNHRIGIYSSTDHVVPIASAH